MRSFTIVLVTKCCLNSQTIGWGIKHTAYTGQMRRGTVFWLEGLKGLWTLQYGGE